MSDFRSHARRPVKHCTKMFPDSGYRGCSFQVIDGPGSSEMSFVFDAVCWFQECVHRCRSWEDEVEQSVYIDGKGKLSSSVVQVAGTWCWRDL